MAWYRCIGGSSSGGGGATIDKIMDKGQVSTTSAYATAQFEKDLTDYSLIYVYFFIGNTSYYPVAVVIDPADLSSTPYSFRAYLNNKVYTFQITLSEITCTQYSGSYVNVYVDVYGVK